jgi:hypothetical protein
MSAGVVPSLLWTIILIVIVLVVIIVLLKVVFAIIAIGPYVIESEASHLQQSYSSLPISVLR